MLLLTRPHLQTTSLPQSQEYKVIKIFAIVSSLEYSRLKILVFFLDLFKKKFSFVISFALEADTCLPLSIIFCHCSSSSGKLFFQGSRQGYKENIPYGCRYKTTNAITWPDVSDIGILTCSAKVFHNSSLMLVIYNFYLHLQEWVNYRLYFIFRITKYNCFDVHKYILWIYLNKVEKSSVQGQTLTKVKPR